MQARGIADDRGVACRELLLQSNGGRQRCPQKLERLFDDGLYMHRDPLGHATAAEAQNAIDERASALRGMHDVVEITPQGTACCSVLLRELAVADDGTQDVVEVMRDATGQRADRLHLLRLPQLRLETLVVRLGAFL